jgi:hypothetical protein
MSSKQQQAGSVGPAGSDRSYIKGAYFVVAGAIVVAVILTILIHAPAIVVGEGFAPFAVIYIVAQAIERLLQPISESKGKAEEVKVVKTNLKAAKESGETTKEAEEEKRLAYRENERAVFFWAAATTIALLVCGVLGLGLIESVAEINGGKVPGWFEALDVVVTGLAIGAGTKPLHDLIGVIQNTKSKQKGEAEATA